MKKPGKKKKPTKKKKGLLSAITAGKYLKGRGKQLERQRKKAMGKK
jgi:hypothetical protein